MSTSDEPSAKAHPFPQPASPAPGSEGEGATDPQGHPGPRPGHAPGTGRFVRGNRDALTHGAYSRQVAGGLLPEQAELVAMLAEKREAIEQDLGGADALTELQRDLIERYTQLELIAHRLAEVVVAAPLTAKGAKRAALSAFLAVTDRQQRLAMTLGLERRSRPINPLDAVALAVAEANRRP
ncbi:MAG: hypothetical protein AB7H93_12160 [Vicinamibacterales bacterium]